jgi:hypothetical protein
MASANGLDQVRQAGGLVGGQVDALALPELDAIVPDGTGTGTNDISRQVGGGGLIRLNGRLGHVHILCMLPGAPGG